MSYSSLEAALLDLEKHGHLLRIREEVDPNLEMAAIHLRVFEQNGPALLFERVKDSSFRACSNLFGNLERSRFLFRDTLAEVQELVALRNDPMKALKQPFRYAGTALSAFKALPKQSSFSSAGFREIRISDLPQIKHWPMDGGAFVTLPQVYSEDPEQPGVRHSNLGMYRVQLNGNDYLQDREIGLHYQLHRGIGVHQSHSNRRNQALKVSVFVGGPPSHTLAAVMPLPEGLSELMFSGTLGGRRFRYAYHEGYCISLDADFVICGEVHPFENKAEGPFGDHLGYYSLKHPFPLMRVHKVFAKANAIWPFTVVGRPPQEDTAFGALIHEISGSAIPNEIPGVKAVHAVDAAGVHPLLLATGSERYTPYLKVTQPSEILTQANRILGTGQLSLAKYLFIATEQGGQPDCHNVAAFLNHVFERIDLSRDLHFHTKTSIDTLDYSGEGLNEGSKLVLAAGTVKIRDLKKTLPPVFSDCPLLNNVLLLLPGVVAFQLSAFVNYSQARQEMEKLNVWFKERLNELEGIVQLVVYDDFDFSGSSQLLRDYLWITYTRSNPSHDIYGVAEFTENKHWGCRGPMIIDARKKPHHAPELRKDPETEKRIGRFFKKGAVLEKWS